MRKLAGIFAILSAFFFAAGPSIAAEKQATLRLINPEIFLKGMRIKHIVATLDGREFGDCWGDRRQPGDVCIKPQPIAPGPHILELLLDPLASTYFQSVDKFTAGMNGEWTLDLKGLAADGAKTGDYLTLFQGLQPVEGCRAALERLASMPSCTTDEFGALGPAFAEALGQCGKDVPEGDKEAIGAAFSAIVDNHFSLELARCYRRVAIEKLPRAVTAYSQPSDGWPLEMGAWRWARDPDVDLSAVTGLAEALDKLQAQLPAMAKRVAVVNEFIDAALSGDPAPVAQAAMSAPFSLDAETPEGQRNLLLLTNPRHFYDAAYADFVADAAAKDKELDCARNDWEVNRMVEYFKEKGTLSASAVNAMLAMSARVPPDLGDGACGSVIDLRIASSVEPAERLRRYFALDCAETRAPQQRGSGLVAFLENAPRTDDAEQRKKRGELQQQMRQELSSCLAAAKQFASAAATSSALAEAAKRGCKIEPNATCSNVTLNRADLHGADLRGAELDQARMEEVDLKDAKLAGADLHDAVLKKADLTGADFTGANLERFFAVESDLHGVKLAGVATMRQANLANSDLHGADLAGVVLSEARLEEVNFESANLIGANLSAAKMTKANLRNSDLRGAKLDGATLRDADLTGAKLEGADLSKTKLDGVTWVTGCKLGPGGKCAGIDLHGLSFYQTDLHGIDLSGANLTGTDLSHAWLEGADLHGADLRDTTIDQTSFRNANLAGANFEGAHGTIPQFVDADMSETILPNGKKCAAGAKANRFGEC